MHAELQNIKSAGEKNERHANHHLFHACLVICFIKAVPKHKQFCDCQPGWKLRRVAKNKKKQQLPVSDNHQGYEASRPHATSRWRGPFTRPYIFWHTTSRHVDCSRSIQAVRKEKRSSCRFRAVCKDRRTQIKQIWNCQSGLGTTLHDTPRQLRKQCNQQKFPFL